MYKRYLLLSTNVYNIIYEYMMYRITNIEKRKEKKKKRRRRMKINVHRNLYHSTDANKKTYKLNYFL